MCFQPPNNTGTGCSEWRLSLQIRCNDPFGKPKNRVAGPSGIYGTAAEHKQQKRGDELCAPVTEHWTHVAKHIKLANRSRETRHHILTCRIAALRDSPFRVDTGSRAVTR